MEHVYPDLHAPSSAMLLPSMPQMHQIHQMHHPASPPSSSYPMPDEPRHLFGSQPYLPYPPPSPYDHSHNQNHNLYYPPTPYYAPPRAMDTTGQIAPPGMRPRLTTSIFEEEGGLCYQVDVNGICVARREDNHMINGTKLLNVAQMTRGRRDGILKAEKQKTVVKVGPMHLKGVWIPYDRALALANQEKITELLYPLFVHDIGALLYHPSNAARIPWIQQQQGGEEGEDGRSRL
ncbi:hypothetical protein M430DRAFT_47391 [Amorphotheca resinae ATCC 22711]|uniref:HTH APSES-type domain-containing protein n=1 Tax=Amorphotheca resinae ATCC 22711 TaxID=857342 RepID=A0A2T3BG46_AMORE|nr:hypothetical protein M430DRAFT_47391 [Amorphotheca resinae ATCC 22711]PSS28386.1 hypothetical protein M430DRAFT_47391 [Amorphotheca resinae ATCC 22711]